MILNEKNNPFKFKAVAPLSSRPLDLLYFVFFCTHIPATLLLDLQTIYPPSLVPSLIARLPALYIGMSGDPLVGGAMGYFGKEISDQMTWFRSFVVLELIFQLPVFLLGIRGLWRASRSIYPLLLVYAASTATTTLPCLALIATAPTTTAETLAAGIPSVTPSHRMLLLSSYIPFFLVPLLMTVDMAVRVTRLVKSGIEKEYIQKRR